MDYLFEFSQLILLFILPICALSACSCNNRDRKQLHLQRRQALRDRQRQAVLSGRSVRSVIETEVDSETTQCPKMTCVRMAPRLKRDVYERVEQCDRVIEKMNGERMEVVVQKSNGKTVKYSDIVSNDYNQSTSSEESILPSIAG